MAESLDKLKSFFGLQPVENYKEDIYEDEFEYDRYSDEPRSSRGYEEPEYSYRNSRPAYESDYYTRPRESYSTPEPEPAREPEVVRITLTSFIHARQIGEAARKGDIVVYDISALPKPEAQRVVDFAAGIQIALGGGTKKLVPRVFAFVPEGVDLSDEQLEQLKPSGSR